MRAIFAGGGTGGHLYPSLAVAEELRKKNTETLFFISDRGIDSRILMKSGHAFIEQDVSPFMGNGITGKAKSLIKLVKGVAKAYPLLKKGDKVLMTGGFASAPVGLAAKLKGCEVYLHEQNSVMGLVNRTFARFCKKVFISFGDTKNVSGNVIVSGNPVRSSFKKAEKKEGWNGRLLILGGSQGSRKINRLMAEAIDYIMAEGFSVVHQTGEGLYRETLSLYGDAAQRYASKLMVCAYIERPASFISESDIVVGRAGSGTVFELMAAGAPAVYIPFAAASENHQYYNAKAAEKEGGAIVLEEKDANPKKFMEALKYMKENIEDFRKSIRSRPYKDASKIIVGEMGLE